MHRKHKLKPHPAALVLLLKIGTLFSVIHLLAFVYVTSDGTSGLECHLDWHQQNFHTMIYHILF